MQLPSVGDVFESRYRLDALLGSGGFATVFRASRLADQHGVAIKVLEPRKNGTYPRDLEARFERESRFLSKLNSPHVVRLFDFGRTPSGLLYLVMELVPGVDLSTLLSERERLAPGEVVHILWQLLAALKEAHSHGVLHRDLKPANIRIYTDGQDPLAVKLLDFGIARGDVLESSLASVTRTGQIVGTPRYMSPEQLSERELTPASDIYSLGVVAFEMLAGEQKMHGGAWLDQVERMRSGHLFAAPDAGAGGPLLMSIVQRMTARKLEHRLPDVDSVLAQLADVDEELPEARDHATLPRLVGSDDEDDATTQVDSRSPLEPVEPRAKTTTYILLAAVFVAVALLIGVPLWSNSGGRAEAPRPRTDLPFVAAAPTPAADASRTPKFHAAPAPVATDAGIDASTVSAHIPRPLRGTRRGCGQQPFVRGLWADVGSDEGDVFDGFTWVPTDYDPERKYPVAFLFHADRSNGHEMLTTTRFHEVAGSDAILIAPTFPVFATMKTRPSLPQALNWLSDRLCIDPHRIFLVGHALGGIAAEMVMCEPMLTGIALNGYRPYAGSDGTLLQKAVNFANTQKFEKPQCENARPTPTILLSPMDSPVMPAFYESPDCGHRPKKMILPVFEEHWRGINKCDAKEPEEIKHDDVTCLQWDCQKKLLSCRVPGVTGWPGSNVAESHAQKRQSDGSDCEDGILPHDFPATEKIWEFLKSLPPGPDHEKITWKPRTTTQER